MTITKEHLETARARLNASVDTQIKALIALLDDAPSPGNDGEKLLRAAKVTDYDAQSIADWPITSDLNNFHVGPGVIRMGHTMHEHWPRKIVWGGLVYGNVWLVAQGWAATWDWVRRATYEKYLSGEDLQRHIKAGGLDRWAPKEGEEVAFFISTLARYGQRTIDERSNVRVIRWPY